MPKVPAELKTCVTSLAHSDIKGAKFSANPPCKSPLVVIIFVTPFIFFALLITCSLSSSINKFILSPIFCAAVIADKVPLSTSIPFDSAITKIDII